MRVSLGPNAQRCGTCVRATPNMLALSASLKTETAQLTVRLGQEDNELMQAARLRAEAYYENDSYNRFKESFIKQFANIEHRRLSNAASAINTATADCLPLVAINSSGACTGSLDIRPNYTPEDPEAAAAAAPGPSAYVCNVVVAPNQRRAGIGRQLVEAAKGIAANQLGATYLYAHVESVNDAASELYSKCGFETVAVEGGVGGTTVGQRILLRCKLERES